MTSILLNNVLYTNVCLAIKQEATFINLYNTEILFFAHEFDTEAEAETAFTSITTALKTGNGFIDFDSIFSA